VRVVVVATLIVLAGASGWLLYPRFAAPPPPPPSTPVVHRQLKDCRDLCEQTAIVEQLAEKQVRTCWASCEAKFPPPPREPIRRITVAPADHSSTIRDDVKIQRQR